MVTATRPAPSPAPKESLTTGSGAVGDTIFWGLCRTSAASILVLALVLFLYILKEAWPAITGLGIDFLLGTAWSPTKEEYGALPFIYGTLWTSAMAMLIAVPLGVATAAFLAEIAPPLLRRVGSFLIELLAAIPSVVYGFWAILFLAPLAKSFFLMMGAPPNVNGKSLFTAGLILAIMILPYVTAISFDVCRAVPRSQREGSLALGATRWQTIWSVVLPYARPGIVGGSFLALGRALGETMAVIMVIGNTPQINLEPYSLAATIPSQIALGLNELGDIQRAALVELGALLLLVTVVVNCAARVMTWRMGRLGKTSVLSDQLAVAFWHYLVPGLVLLAIGLVAVRLSAALTGTALTDPEAFGLALAAGAVLIGVAAVLQKMIGRSSRGSVWVNRLMTCVLALCLAITCVPLFLILGFVFVKGATALDMDFFTRIPNSEPPGLGHAVLGSAILVGLATIFAVPIGILAAIFLAENPNSKLASSVRFVGELLGGVPSIVIGIFAYALLVAPGGWLSRGHFSAWAGAFALGVMMIPIAMRGSEEALKLVPQSLRHASYALGAARWQTVLRVIVPAAMPAVITAVCLAIARIAGETAPLLLTCNQTSYWPLTRDHSFPYLTLDHDFPYLTYYIYNYSTSTDPVEKRLAWAAAFVLLTVVMLVNIGIRFLTGKRVVLASRAD